MYNRYHITIVWSDGTVYSKVAPTETNMNIEEVTDILDDTYSGMVLSITVEQIQ